MKFFVPGIEDTQKAEERYENMRSYVEQHYGALSDKRYLSVTFNHNGKVEFSRVGQPDSINGALVLAIFRQLGGSAYFVYADQDRTRMVTPAIPEQDVLEFE